MHGLAKFIAECGVLAMRAVIWSTASCRNAACRVWSLALLRSASGKHIPLRTQFDGAVHTVGRLNLSLGEHCRLGRGAFFETSGQGRIEIGRHVRINAGCILVAYTLVSIGDNCLIGEYVSIRDANHGTESGMPIRLQPHRTAPIRIGSDVWIGRGVAVLPGVTIGDGAVIGANSVVNKDVPPRVVAAGVPARVIRSLDPEQLQVESA